MPVEKFTRNIWSNYTNDQAFDAYAWNAGITSGGNLGYLKNIESNITAYLQLAKTSTTIVNNTATTISWSSATFQQNCPYMWSATANPSTIYLRTQDGNETTPTIWLIECSVTYAASTSQTARYINIIVDDQFASFSTIDRYEESSASVHTYSIMTLTGESTTVPSFTVNILQNSGANIAATATLYVRAIPSAAKNFFDGYA